MGLQGQFSFAGDLQVAVLEVTVPWQVVRSQVGGVESQTMGVVVVVVEDGGMVVEVEVAVEVVKVVKVVEVVEVVEVLVEVVTVVEVVEAVDVVDVVEVLVEVWVVEVVVLRTW